jgi:hypothetical protein
MPQEVKVEKPTSSAGALNARLKGWDTSRRLVGRARRLVAVAVMAVWTKRIWTIIPPRAGGQAIAKQARTLSATPRRHRRKLPASDRRSSSSAVATMILSGDYLRYLMRERRHPRRCNLKSRKQQRSTKATAKRLAHDEIGALHTAGMRSACSRCGPGG